MSRGVMVKLWEKIGGKTNHDGQYDDIYLPQNVGLFGDPATDRTIDAFAVVSAMMVAGALGFRLWRAKGPGRRKVRRESEESG